LPNGIGKAEPLGIHAREDLVINGPEWWEVYSGCLRRGLSMVADPKNQIRGNDGRFRPVSDPRNKRVPIQLTRAQFLRLRRLAALNGESMASLLLRLAKHGGLDQALRDVPM